MRGESVDIWPSHLDDRAWRISLFGDEIDGIREFDPLTGEVTAEMERVAIYANSHYVTPRPTLTQAIARIKVELKERLARAARPRASCWSASAWNSAPSSTSR